MSCELCEAPFKKVESDELHTKVMGLFELPNFKTTLYTCRCPEIFFDHLAHVKHHGMHIMAKPNGRDIFNNISGKKAATYDEIQKYMLVSPTDIKDTAARENYVTARQQLYNHIKECDNQLWKLIYN